MKNYIKTLKPEIQEYFNILSPQGVPEFLNEYIETPKMQQQSQISMTCGTIYSKMFQNKFWYSSLDHSIGVALIIWHFTKDKKQTISGLFHDIATPVFKHVIDYMNGDYEIQESTEELTSQMILESKEIMELLKKDEIKIEEVEDYHKYPIADNDTPQLSSDRLEYTLINGLGATEQLWDLAEVKKIYENIEVQKNEDLIQELGFRNQEIAERFVHGMSILSNKYIENRTKYSMQFLADIIKKMSEKKLISAKDLYILSEKEIIEKIKRCKENNISTNFEIWQNATQIKESDEPIPGKYCVSVEHPKVRYIVPLVKVEKDYIRVNKLSSKANQDIDKARNFKTRKFAYLDFTF